MLCDDLCCEISRNLGSFDCVTVLFKSKSCMTGAGEISMDRLIPAFKSRFIHLSYYAQRQSAEGPSSNTSKLTVHFSSLVDFDVTQPHHATDANLASPHMPCLTRRIATFLRRLGICESVSSTLTLRPARQRWIRPDPSGPARTYGENVQ
jgi:hypothetical protein